MLPGELWYRATTKLGGRAFLWLYTVDSVHPRYCTVQSVEVQPRSIFPPGGRQGCLKASACPVRSMKESMEERWEPREGLASRGCRKGPPGLVSTLT